MFHRGVVGHDEDSFRPVPHGGVDLHRVDPVGAVAVDRDHLTVRAGQRGGDRERHADPEAPEGARVEIGGRRKADAGEAQQIAAIGHGDVVPGPRRT